MLKLSSSTEFMAVPVTGPVADLTGYAVSVALIPVAAGTEPLDTDYKAAAWNSAGEAMLLVHPADWVAGQYTAYVRVVAAPEDVRMRSGLVRIGDART